MIRNGLILLEANAGEDVYDETDEALYVTGTTSSYWIGS